MPVAVPLRRAFLIGGLMPVAQEHGYGCAVACVAEILGVSYAEALSYFHDGFRKATTEGFYLAEICLVMQAQGWQSYWVAAQPYFVPKQGQLHTIAFLPKGDLYPAGHYVVQDYKDRWSNSYVNFPAWPAKAGLHKELPLQPEYLIFNSRLRRKGVVQS